MRDLACATHVARLSPAGRVRPGPCPDTQNNPGFFRSIYKDAKKRKSERAANDFIPKKMPAKNWAPRVDSGFRNVNNISNPSARQPFAFLMSAPSTVCPERKPNGTATGVRNA